MKRLLYYFFVLKIHTKSLPSPNIAFRYGTSHHVHQAKYFWSSRKMWSLERFLVESSLIGTVNVISRQFQCKNGKAGFTRVLYNLYRSIMWIDMSFPWSLKLFNYNNSYTFPCSLSAQVKFEKKPKLKIISL